MCKENNKFGIIFGLGEYPIGSGAKRMRMWRKSLKYYKIDTEIIIPFPAPSYQDINNSEKFVHFMLRPQKKLSSTLLMKRNFKHIYGKIAGLIKSISFIRKKKEKIDFIFLYGGGFFEGLVLHRFCKRREIKFFIERTDENRRKFKKKKNLYDFLAIAYEELFERFIIQKCSTLFVVSKYLEKKFRDKFSQLRIKQTSPSIIDIIEFREQQKKNIFELDITEIDVFKSDRFKFVFAGSCIFTNGLKFFLKNAAELIKEGYDFEIIFIIFKGYIKEMLEYVDHLGISKNFTLIENVMHDYIPACYKHADALILPEMGKEVAKAGFPGKTAEYLASVKPIIATNFSNISDVLKHNYNCLMSELGDDYSYRLHMEELLRNKKLRKLLGKRARETAITKFNFEKFALPIVSYLNRS